MVCIAQIVCRSLHFPKIFWCSAFKKKKLTIDLIWRMLTKSAYCDKTWDCVNSPPRRRRKILGVGLSGGGSVQTAWGLSPPKAKILATCLLALKTTAKYYKKQPRKLLTYRAHSYKARQLLNYKRICKTESVLLCWTTDDMLFIN